MDLPGTHIALSPHLREAVVDRTPVAGTAKRPVFGSWIAVYYKATHKPERTRMAGLHHAGHMWLDAFPTPICLQVCWRDNHHVQVSRCKGVGL